MLSDLGRCVFVDILCTSFSSLHGLHGDTSINLEYLVWLLLAPWRWNVNLFYMWNLDLVTFLGYLKSFPSEKIIVSHRIHTYVYIKHEIECVGPSWYFVFISINPHKTCDGCVMFEGLCCSSVVMAMEIKLFAVLYSINESVERVLELDNDPQWFRHFCTLFLKAVQLYAIMMLVWLIWFLHWILRSLLWKCYRYDSTLTTFSKLRKNKHCICNNRTLHTQKKNPTGFINFNHLCYSHKLIVW